MLNALARFRRAACRPLLIGLLGLVYLTGCSHARPTHHNATSRGTPAAATTGEASYYASKFDGRPTANGERFDNRKLTAAHRTLPFGTRVRVTNLSNGR